MPKGGPEAIPGGDFFRFLEEMDPIEYSVFSIWGSATAGALMVLTRKRGLSLREATVFLAAAILNLAPPPDQEQPVDFPPQVLH